MPSIIKTATYGGYTRYLVKWSPREQYVYEVPDTYVRAIDRLMTYRPGEAANLAKAHAVDVVNVAVESIAAADYDAEQLIDLYLKKVDKTDTSTEFKKRTAKGAKVKSDKLADSPYRDTDPE